MVRNPESGSPVGPGEIIREEFLEPLSMTQVELARRIGVSFQRVNEIVNGRRSVTADTALRLSALFGPAPAFWLNAQMAIDLYRARQVEGVAIEKIERVGTA